MAHARPCPVSQLVGLFREAIGKIVRHRMRLVLVEALARGDIDELTRFREAPGMPYAHPTVEHFTPIFVALGAATDPEAAPETTITGPSSQASRICADPRICPAG